MNRFLLPALLAAMPVFAEDLGVCRAVPYSKDNCFRVLACVGSDGLWFDGRGRGWNTGTASGYRSDDVFCEGTWTADGPMGAGLGEMTCEDGLQINVLYYNQDNETSTAIGGGTDSLNRPVQIWSGNNVLQFLTGPGAFGPALPCAAGDIPLS